MKQAVFPSPFLVYIHFSENLTYFLCRQVDRDCEFLEQERIMDYSLLVGVHFTEALNDELTPSGARTPIGNYFLLVAPKIYHPTSLTLDSIAILFFLDHSHLVLIQECFKNQKLVFSFFFFLFRQWRLRK